MIRSKTIYQNNFENHTIFTNEALGFGCKETMLYKAKEFLDKYIQSHSKVLFTRFDLHPPQCMTLKDNKILSNFLDSFTKNLGRKGLQPAVFWCAEKSESGNLHYHLAVLTYAQKSQSIYPIFNTATKLWSKALDLPDVGGLINYCAHDKFGKKQENGIRIDQWSPGRYDAYDKVFKWLSYLCKERSKDETPRRVRGYSCSQIKRE